MYRPKQPCEGCTDRNLDNCLACEKWKAYKAEIIKFYDEELSRKSIDRANFALGSKAIKERQRKKGYKHFHVK